jgi:hypothetical protein
VGDNAIVLNSLSTGFDKLQYGTMLVSAASDAGATDPLAAR